MGWVLPLSILAGGSQSGKSGISSSCYRGQSTPTSRGGRLLRRREQQGEYLFQIFLVVLEDAAGISLMVAPGNEKLGRNLVVRVAYDFTNVGMLPMRDLIADRWDIEEPFAD